MATTPLSPGGRPRGDGVIHLRIVPKAGAPGPDPAAGGMASAMEEAGLERRMRRLAQGQQLLELIEDLSRQWLDRVCGAELTTAEALELLLTSLETNLEEPED
jgi:hypothetical protein